MDCKKHEQYINHGLVKQLGGICFGQNENGSHQFRAKIQAIHLNSKGATHGGFIMTFLDTGMGFAVRSVLEPGQLAVTVSFNVQFIGPAAEGDIIVGHAFIRRKTRSLVFMHGEVQVGEKLIASADGIWKIL